MLSIQFLNSADFLNPVETLTHISQNDYIMMKMVIFLFFPQIKRDDQLKYIGKIFHFLPW